NLREILRRGDPSGQRGRLVEQLSVTWFAAAAPDGAQDPQRVELIRRRDARDGEQLGADIRSLVPTPEQQQCIRLRASHTPPGRAQLASLAQCHASAVIALGLLQLLRV